MIKQLITQKLEEALEELGFQPTDIFLSIPPQRDFGDYSTNIALQLSNQNSKDTSHSGREIANSISEKLSGLDFLERVEIAGPGFLNFFLKDEFLAADIDEILFNQKDFGKSQKGKNKSARVEYVSANPTGPLHIGNARGGPIGDVIANVLEAVGYKVLREYIHNDAGNQVKELGTTIKAISQNKLTDEHQYKGEYVKELASQLNDQLEDKSPEEIGKLAVDIMLEDILKDTTELGIKFDYIVRETELRERAPAVIEYLKDKGVTKEKDGALWFAPSDEFLKDRETVLIKSDGGYTYFTADVVYHQEKFESNPDLVVDLFGPDHHGHKPRIQAVVKALGYDTSKLIVMIYQYVKVKKNGQILKLSKRAGNIVSAREVLDEVGPDSFRFIMLSMSSQTHLDFDIDLLKEQSSKNPVFYVQYAHARMENLIAKVLEKAPSLRNVILGNEVTPESKKAGSWTSQDDITLESAERELLLHLSEFPSLVEEISKSFEVHHLTTYSIKLADLFHKFYEKCKVLGAQNQNIQTFRLQLVKASQIVLKNSLDLLGVSAPKKM